MVVTALEKGKKNKDRTNIYVDDEYSFSLYNLIIIKRNIRVGTVISQEIIENLKKQDEFLGCYNNACLILSYGQNTKKNLRDKLIKKGYDKNIIPLVIKKLDEKKYLNDVDFALEYVALLLKKGYGKKIISQKLYEKGIEKPDRDFALSSIDMEEIIKWAIEYANKISHKYEGEKELVFALTKRGYNYDVAKRAAKEIAYEDEELNGYNKV